MEQVRKGVRPIAISGDQKTLVDVAVAAIISRRAGGEKLARALRFFADRPDPVLDRIARRLDAGLALRPRRGDQRANLLRLLPPHVGHDRLDAAQIGRSSCRERVWQYALNSLISV